MKPAKQNFMLAIAVRVSLLLDYIKVELLQGDHILADDLEVGKREGY